MRTFIILGHTAATDPDFLLRDMPGSAGRLDVLCRCITAGLLRSHGLREDTRIILVLQEEYVITVDGATVQYLNPDERSTGALVRKALEKASVVDVSTKTVSSPGITIQHGDLASVLADLPDESTVIQLHEAGADPRKTDIPEHPVFVLSDHKEFTDAEERWLADAADGRIRLGPTVLHADQTVTVAHHWLDTQGYTEF